MKITPGDIQNGFRFEWHIPLSKSIYNRLAVIQKLADHDLPEIDQNQPDDIHAMRRLLISNADRIDVQHAGTAARFGMAYLALKTKKTIILTGSAALQRRPMGELIEALRLLGARIKEIAEPNHLPVIIEPAVLSGKSIELDGSISSQYTSALCMIAPLLAEGLSIDFKNEITSRPYLDMTLELMRRQGIELEFSNRKIRIKNGQYRVIDNELEKDFSAAHYAWAWTQLMHKPILVRDLKLESIQGDAHFSLGSRMWEKSNGGLRCVLYSPSNFPEEIDFSDNPDLAPTYICLYAAMGRKGVFTGLQTLNSKESRRLDVLVRELKNAGFITRTNGSDRMELLGGTYTPYKFPTYDDHRMAMSFALFGAIGKVEIENPEVVSKSFPSYWNMILGRKNP